jgi:choline-sulfatase
VSRQLQFALVVAVLANIAVLAWLLVRTPADSTPRDLGAVLEPLVDDPTMQTTRYDLSGGPGAKGHNVILVSLDALRADRLGTGLTPNLDAFADESVVFNDVMSTAPWTLPAHMSVWTGRWPTVHGVTNKLRLLARDQMVETVLSPGIETFPDRLIQEGYVAAAFTGGAGVQGRYGFGRGFEPYVDDRYFGGTDYSGPKAVEWLRENRDERFFLFLHGYDVHGQFPLPDAALSGVDYDGALDGGIEEQASLRERGLGAIDEPGAPSVLGGLDEGDTAFLERVYDLKVRALDERFGRFIGELRALGLLDDTVVIVMSDHGDEFMEHGAVDHGHTLYQEQLHTVMMMRFPGYARRQDVDQVARTVDLFPTVFDALGIEPPRDIDGVSLLPMMRGLDQPLMGFAETDYRLYVHHRAIRRGDHKLILDLMDGGRELYDLSTDPTEQHDISSAEPRLTYELAQELQTWMQTVGTNPQDYLGVDQKPIEIF